MATATPDTKAQDTNKAPAAAAPKKGTFNKVRFEELLKKVTSDEGLTDDENKEFVLELGYKNDSEKEERTKLSAIVDAVIASGYPFSKIYKAVILKNDGKKAEIASLFTQEEIAAAFKAGGGKAPRAAKGTAAPKKTGPAELDPDAFLNFKSPSANGRATTLKINGEFPAVFGASWQWLKTLEGGVKANLDKVIVKTPKAAEFAESKAGKEYIQKLHDWVSNDGKKAKK